MDRIAYVSQNLLFTEIVFHLNAVGIVPMYGEWKDVPEDERDFVQKVEIEGAPEDY